MILEPLPEDPIASEVVLYLRRSVRRRAAEQQVELEDLARYFGITVDAARDAGVARALTADDPILAAASVLRARLQRVDGPIVLPHDARYVSELTAWLRARKEAEPALGGIVATDPATLLVVARAMDIVERVDRDALAKRPVLIEGPSGTGKELLAQALHAKLRAVRGDLQTPFVPVHVAGMSTDMINDELFGHRTGAYTGARDERQGRIAEANRGVLFIDEVGDLPGDAQVRLLRVLQDGRYSRIGENAHRQSDALIVAATWRDLDTEVREGRFRSDLFHRLAGVRLRLPALRERGGFEGEVADRVLGALGRDPRRGVRRSLRVALRHHPWSGNLREFRFALEEAVFNAGRAPLQVADLPAEVRSSYAQAPLVERCAAEIADATEDRVDRERSLAAAITHATAQIHDRTQHRTVPECELHRLYQFFREVVDPTEDHAALLETIRGGILAWERLHARREDLAEWEGILALVPEARDELERRIGEVAREIEALQDDRETERAVARARENGLGRLYLDLLRTPLGRLDRGEAVRVLALMAVSVLGTLSPDIVRALKELGRVGGLDEVRTFLGEQAGETAGSPREVPPASTPWNEAREWGAEQWRDAYERHGRNATALADELGVTDRTVRHYLRKHDIRRESGEASSIDGVGSVSATQA